MEITNSPIVDDHTLPSQDTPLDPSKISTVTTLQPYTLDPLPQRNGRSRRANNKNKNEYEIMPGVYQPVDFNKFLTVKFDNDRRVQDLDFLKIGNEIIKVCEQEPKIMFQSDGSLLIEASSAKESLKLQSMTVLNGNTVKCAPHRSMNQCRGVIRSTLLMRYSEERLLEEFESQRVIAVKQMKKHINGVLTPLPTYILTFDLLKLPQEIKASWLRFQVRPYVPTPRRCFYCQRFGHVSNTCRRKLKGEKRICDNLLSR